MTEEAKVNDAIKSAFITTLKITNAFPQNRIDDENIKNILESEYTKNLLKGSSKGGGSSITETGGKRNYTKHRRLPKNRSRGKKGSRRSYKK